MQISIHAKTGVQWHKRYAEFFRKGFAAHGIDARVTAAGTRDTDDDVAVVFGPNYFKGVERSGLPYLMVNRVLLSTNPRHVNDVVAISWDGFNGRGTFCVDEITPGRLDRFINPQKDVRGWRKEGEYLLLCGQADVGRCGRYSTVGEFYRYVEGTTNEEVVYRPHPNNGSARLPLRTHLHSARVACVLNSTVAVDALLAGVPVISLDEGNPVHAVASHVMAETVFPNRLPFFRYLAECQYFFGEIENGLFWERLNPKRGARLCEYEA